MDLEAADAEVLVEIRDIIATIHDRHIGFGNGLSQIEQAAMRDCIRRLNEVISKPMKRKNTHENATEKTPLETVPRER